MDSIHIKPINCERKTFSKCPPMKIANELNRTIQHKYTTNLSTSNGFGEKCMERENEIGSYRLRQFSYMFYVEWYI